MKKFVLTLCCLISTLFIPVTNVKAEDAELCGAFRYVHDWVSDSYHSCLLDGYYEIVNGIPTNVNLHCADGFHEYVGYYVEGNYIHVTIKIDSIQYLHANIRYK